MGGLYEKQDDNSLKPVEYPEWVVKRLAIYLMLRDKNLDLEEIRFIWDGHLTE